MSFRPAEQMRETNSLPSSILAQTAAMRVGMLALVLILLWLAIAWAVALP